MTLDDFLCEGQVEDIYDERIKEELNSYYDWLNNKQDDQQEPDQSGRESLR